MNLVNLVLFIACFASFTWALQGGLFRKSVSRNLGIQVTRVLGLVFMCVHFVLLVSQINEQPVVVQSLAIPIYMCALLLFWSAVGVTSRRPLSLAFADEPPTHLVKQGPYRWVRHPFYSSYLLGWIGGAVATLEPSLLFTVAVMAWIYYRAATSEESRFLASPLGKVYQEYQSHTWMFFPKLNRKGA